MTPAGAGATDARQRVPDAIVEAEGWTKVRRWAVGALGLLGVGLLVPTAMLAVGIPIALVVRVGLDFLGML